MRKKPDERVLKEINALFELAEKSKEQPLIASSYIKKARKLAKCNNISLKEYRKLFCKKCNNYFTAENCQIRIRRGMKTIKCLKCGAYRRFRIF